jgi:hypothetical protein
MASSFWDSFAGAISAMYEKIDLLEFRDSANGARNARQASMRLRLKEAEAEGYYGLKNTDSNDSRKIEWLELRLSTAEHRRRHLLSRKITALSLNVSIVQFLMQDKAAVSKLACSSPVELDSAQNFGNC